MLALTSFPLATIVNLERLNLNLLSQGSTHPNKEQPNLKNVPKVNSQISSKQHLAKDAQLATSARTKATHSLLFVLKVLIELY